MEKQNKMQKIEIEKIVLNCGATGNELEKSFKLLKMITGQKPMKTASKKRIPSLGVRPGLEIGCMVTIRGKKAGELLKRILVAVENTISRKKIKENHFSFGVDEYIEVPGLEFQRDIGIIGFNVTVVFSRKGKRVNRRKIKKNKISKKQTVSEQEIIDFMKEKFNMEVK
jgi:large subunit ribosomal protein L5